MPSLWLKLLRLFGVGVLILFYQNCSNVDFNPRVMDDGGTNLPSGGPVAEDEGSPGDQQGFETLTKTIDVGVDGDVDILFVIDNSGSMRSEQDKLSERISGFMEVIKDLNWQIAMTTTDPRSGAIVSGPDGKSRAWGDGQFRPFDGNGGSQYILKANRQPDAVAQQWLSEAINVGTRGSGDERGINATYRAIEHMNESSIHADFFRPQASLAVVVISDEDECSRFDCRDRNHGADNSKSVPDNLISHVLQTFGPEKPFNFHSIIWVPGDNSCNTAPYAGNTYQRLSQLTGGVSGSICADNYSQILTDMGERVVELVESTQLSCPPADIDNDGKLDLFVTLEDGDILFTSDFQLEGTRVRFNEPLPPGRHQVTYYCAR